MPRSKRTLIGRLAREIDGTVATLRVYKQGRDYWLSSGTHDHLCHRSVSSTEKLRGEALMVFQMRGGEFEAV